MSDIYCHRHNWYTWRVECWLYSHLQVTGCHNNDIFISFYFNLNINSEMSCVEYILDTDNVQKNIFKMNQQLTVTFREPPRIIIAWNSGTAGFIELWTDASRSQNGFVSFAGMLVRILWMHLQICLFALLYLDRHEDTMFVQCHIVSLETR
jgi:hypothetical protein